jgi:hypothetical protein
MASSVPYLTEDQIRKNYAKAFSDYSKQRNTEANRAIAKTNTQYDTAQRGNYINYMQNQRELPEQLAAQGITGGASETSLLRARTNYENNYNNTERSRGADIGAIRSNLADALNTYRMTADQNMNDEIAQNRQLRANYEHQLQQEAEQRFANTISGYNSISGINKLIDRIKKTGKDTWRIGYLRARRTELINEQKAEEEAAAAHSSSGGGGGYSYSGGGGGGNDTPIYDNTPQEEEENNNSGGGGVKSVKQRAEELAKKRRKEAEKSFRNRVKGGVLHAGRKTNASKPYYTRAGYANGYRGIR